MSIGFDFSARRYDWIPFLLPFVYLSFSPHFVNFTFKFLFFKFYFDIGNFVGPVRTFVLLPCFQIRFGHSLFHKISVDFSFWHTNIVYRFFKKY